MRLILLLLAIYTLIFYQQHKIQASKTSTTERVARRSDPPKEGDLKDQQDYRAVNFPTRTNSPKDPERRPNKPGLLQ